MAHVEDRWEKVVAGRRVKTERFGKGARWRARYEDPECRERSRTFARKVDAERFLAGVEADKARGLYVDPSAGRQTVAEYAAQWQAAQVHRDSTTAVIESHMRVHVLPHLGHRPLAAVTRSEVQAWVKGRSQVLAPTTTKTVYSVLRMMFRSAVGDRLLGISPCERISLPKAPPREIHPLPHDAVGRLVEVADPRFRALLVTAVGTGLRQGELFGLRRDRVDFLRRQLVVDGQLVLLTGGPPKLGPPKTQASYRTVPIPDVVLEALAEHFVSWPAAVVLDAAGAEHELVFASHGGHPIRRTAFHARVWSKTLAAAGIPRGTRFHELRHYFASVLIEGGESVKAVQARLGHASAEETLNTYAHLWPESEDRTRAVVDAALFGLTARSRPEQGVSTV